MEAATAQQSSLRRTNLALVLRTVCASTRPLSRADVALQTSSTRATAGAHVDALIASGLLDEIERTGARRPGRPGQPLAAGSRVAALGLEVAVGGLAARIIGLAGNTVAEGSEPCQLRGSDPTATLRRLGRLARGVLKQVPSDVRIVESALAVPGLVTTDQILYAPNLAWSNVSPARLLTPGSLARRPLRLGNEADFAAWTVAEPTPGQPSGVGDFLYVSAEAGIGGALVRDGAIRRGSRGWASEIGHVCVDPHGPLCPCGANGCLEQYVGRDALLDADKGHPGGDVTSLVRRAQAGSRRASRIVDSAVDALAVALATVLNILDVPTVVLAGHLGQLAEARRERLEAALNARVLVSRWARPTLVTMAPTVGAGASGAALACLGDVLVDPAAYFPKL
jgi:predicted NBD/HSP70 family sugar kinase